MNCTSHGKCSFVIDSENASSPAPAPAPPVSASCVLRIIDVSTTESTGNYLWTVTLGSEVADGAEPEPAVGRLNSGNSATDGNLTVLEALALSFRATSMVEDGLMFAVSSLGVVALPITGVSLIGTGHHFFSSDVRGP